MCVCVSTVYLWLDHLMQPIYGNRLQLFFSRPIISRDRPQGIFAWQLFVMTETKKNKKNNRNEKSWEVKWFHLCQVTVPDESAGNLRASGLDRRIRWVASGWASCRAKLLWRTSFSVARCGSLGDRERWPGWGWGWRGAAGPLGPGPPPGLGWGKAEAGRPAWRRLPGPPWAGSRGWPEAGPRTGPRPGCSRAGVLKSGHPDPECSNHRISVSAASGAQH